MTIYQLLPPLSSDEYAALKADIAARGVQVPIEFDEAGSPLDGHHRLRACDELGIAEYPRIVRIGMSEQQKVEHVLALNLARRHLSREQQRELNAQLHRDGWSTRRIAETTGQDHVTVWRDTAGVSFETPDTVSGRDGKSYPAQRPAPAPVRWDSQAFEADPEPPEQSYVDPEWPEESAFNVPPPAPKAAHVAYNSGENEWYTPPEYLDAARAIAQEAPQTAETFTAATEFALCPDGSLCIDRSHREQWIGGIGVARCVACWKRGLAA